MNSKRLSWFWYVAISISFDQKNRPNEINEVCKIFEIS